MLNPVTSQSINSPAIVQHKIAQEYRIHWFLGLRQSELFILDRAGAIEYTKSELKIADIKRRRLEIESVELLKIANCPIDDRSALAALDVEEKQIHINNLNRQIEKTEYQIRDAFAELHEANRMRMLITRDHAEEIDNMSFGELQEVFGVECIEAKQADSLCIEVMALSVGRPIAEILNSIEPSRSDSVLSGAIDTYKSMSEFPNLIMKSLPGK